MGKKIAAEMEVQRARFVDGAVERGINKTQAGNDFRSCGEIRELRL
jgi:DNA polymerase-3 subunit alpha